MTLPQSSRHVRPRLAYWALLLLIVWVAFSLRLYRLDAQELWGDESASVGARRLSEAQVLLGKTDVHPPLYFFTLREAMLLFGDEPVRHSLCVRVLGRARRPVGVPHRQARDERAGGRSGGPLCSGLGVAGLLFARSTHVHDGDGVGGCVAVVYGRAVAGVLPFSPAGRRAGDEGRSWWIAFILTSLIGMYTHYFVAFVVIAEGLALLVGRAARPADVHPARRGDGDRRRGLCAVDSDSAPVCHDPGLRAVGTSSRLACSSRSSGKR